MELKQWELYAIIGGGALFLFVLFCLVIACIYFILRSYKREGYETLNTTDVLVGDAGPRSNQGGFNKYLRENVGGTEEQEETRKHRDEALLHARFYLRSSACNLSKQLLNIGSRKYKTYFLIRHPRLGKQILTMTPLGAHCAISLHLDSTKATFSNLLVNVKHPYIYPTLEADYLTEREHVVIVRPYNSKGTLKDLIYGCSPQGTYARKYLGKKQGTALKLKVIARYGRQIIEGMQFLVGKGFPHVHLHSGNIIIQDGVCRLTDFENGILNMIPYLQPFFIKLNTRHPSVIAFGCVLYEMAVGYEIQSPELLYIPPACSRAIKEALVAIFGEKEELERTGLDPVLSLADLLKIPLFGNVHLSGHSTKKTRIDAKGKELLKLALKDSIVGNPEVVKDRRTQTQRARKSKRRLSRRNSKNSMARRSGSLSRSARQSSPITAKVAPKPQTVSHTPPAERVTQKQTPSAQPRGALLSSITGFNKSGLAPAQTIDKSGPRISNN